MRTTLIGLTAFAVAVLTLHHAPAPTYEPPPAPPSTQAINAIVGDASFYEAYGHAPDAATGEDLRIRTHLAYVLRRLGDVPVTEVAPDLRAARARNLARLADYIALGTFPRNPASVRVRTPNFLDAQGRICAVGYLVREDLGAAAIEAINREYQFARIEDMESAALAAWQATSGLTVLELAAIQPAYCPDDPNCGGVVILPPEEPKATAADISAGGGSLALAAFTGWQLAHGRKSMALGLGTIGVGFASVALALRSDAPASRFNAAAGAVAVLTGLVQASRSNNTPQAVAAAAPRIQLQPMIRDGGTQALAVQLRF